MGGTALAAAGAADAAGRRGRELGRLISWGIPVGAGIWGNPSTQPGHWQITSVSCDLGEPLSRRNPLTGEWTPPYGDESSVHRGHANVLKMIRDAVEHRVTIHHGHMGEIEITSDTTARGIWAMEDVVVNAPGGEPIDMHGSGHYHDSYVRLADGWAILTTKITRLALKLDDRRGATNFPRCREVESVEAMWSVRT
eukprot:gene30428-40429_t